MLFPLLLSILAGPFNAEKPATGPVLTPDARGASAPDRSFDLQKLTLDLAIDPLARAVSGTAHFALTRLSPGPLILDQVALQISDVRVGGQPAPWRIAGDTLVIEIPSKIGEAATVDVTYSAHPRDGLHFRGPGPGSSDSFPHVYSQGEANDNSYWFPGWDHPNDRFVYDGHITGPKGWTVITNPTDDLVNYLIMVAMGPYEEHRVGDNVVTVPPGTSAGAVSRVLDPIPRIRAHYEQRTGAAYPWGTYRQTFVDRFLYTGMENAGSTVEDARMLIPDSAAGTAYWVQSIAAHELAHQWFGDLLTCRSWRDLWLNEGFATFMAQDWTKTALGDPAWAREVRGSMQNSLTGPPLAGRFFDGRGASDNGRVYDKGASVLHMLRVMLGEDTFWAGVQRYVHDHSRGLVDSADLQHAMEAVSGQELGWFFQQWVELPTIPKLTVRARYEDGHEIVSIQQQVSAEAPAYTLPVEVELGTKNGPVVKTRWLDDDGMDLSVDLPVAPLYVAFDPRGGVLATVDQKQDPAAWEAQLQSPSPFARLAAFAALGDTDHPDALAAVLKDGKQPVAYRQAAAAALGEQRQVAPLVAVDGDPNDDVRNAVAIALGRAYGTMARDALTSRIKIETNPDIQASLLRSLGAVDADAALPLARKALRTPERGAEDLRHAAADILGDHGGVGDMTELLDPKTTFVRHASPLWAASKIVARQDNGVAKDALRARVARAAEVLLDDPDLRTRQAIVSLLGEVGDGITVPKLEAFRREETISDLADAAEDAVKAIQSRASAPAASPNEVDARLDALEKKQGEMEDRLKKMEDGR